MSAPDRDSSRPRVHVEEVVLVTESLVERIGVMLRQLSASSPPTARQIEEIVASPGSRLLVACDDGGAVVGTLTLLLSRVPTGLQARLEDVVVDEHARRGGAGEALIGLGMRLAGEAGARKIDLTCRPHREEATRLYRRMGFTLRETGTYRYSPPLGADLPPAQPTVGDGGSEPGSADATARRPWFVTHSERVYESRWFNVLRQSVRVPDGSQRDYHTLDFPGPAVAVVVRRADEILLIRQYRFIVDEYVWAIASGGVEDGETLEDAARREVAEETGHAVGKLEHLMGFYASYGCGNQRFEVFLADDPEPLGGSHDRNEVISTRWFSRQDVVAMLLRDEICDALSLAPLMKLCLRDG